MNKKAKAEKELGLSRPKDRSLEAFKEWVTGMVKHMNPDAPASTTTDEEWERDWKVFWSEAPAEDKPAA